MKLFIVLLFALPLSIPLLIAGFIWGLTKPDRNTYLNEIAFTASCLLNIVCAEMFNSLLIEKEGYQFGEVGETSSSVLGKNKLTDTLTDVGKFVCWSVELFYKNHFINNIQK